MNNQQQTLKALSMLQLAYTTDMSEQRILLYVNMLGDVNPVTLKQAVANLINKCKFLPTIAEIREECSAISAYVNAHEEIPTAQSAWEQVIKCASTYGYEHGLEHLDGLTLKCAKSIWSSFDPRRGDDYNESSCRAQFIKQYEQEAKRGLHRQRMANSIKANHILSQARENAERERALIGAGHKQIEMTHTGRLVEVVKEPVDIEQVIGNLKPELQTIIRSVMKGEADE